MNMLFDPYLDDPNDEEQPLLSIQTEHEDNEATPSLKQSHSTIKTQPRSGKRVKDGTRKGIFTEGVPYVTLTLSIIDVAVFVAEVIYNGGLEPLRENPWWGVSAQTLLDFQAKYGCYILKGEVWRLITPVFVHLGVFHVILNVATQVFIGISLERNYSSWSLLFVYFVGALGGNLLSSIFLPKQIEAGASTGIVAWMSMPAVELIKNWKFYKYQDENSGGTAKKTERKKNERKKALLCTVRCKFLGILFLSFAALFAFGLMPYVDNFAHLGGFFFGMIATVVCIPKLLMAERTSQASADGGSGGSRVVLLLQVKSSTSTRLIATLLLLLSLACGFSIFYLGIDIEKHWHWAEYLNCVPIFHWDCALTSPCTNSSSTY